MQTQNHTLPAGVPQTPYFLTGGDEHQRTLDWLDSVVRKTGANIVHFTIGLTPTLAKILLERNPSNRWVSRVYVDRYIADLKAGTWALTGENIKVSREGTLNDGQHRCLAVAESGITMPVVITFGLERETRLMLDQGKGRNSTDRIVVASLDVSDPRTAGVVARMLWQWERAGTVTDGGIGRTAARGGVTWPTAADIQRVTEENLGEISAALKFVPKVPRFYGSRPLLVFLHIIFSRVDRIFAEIFLQQVLNRTTPVSGSPAHVLQQRLQGDIKLNTDERVEAYVRAWNVARRLLRGKRESFSKIQLNGNMPALER